MPLSGDRVRLLEERLRLLAAGSGVLLYDLDCARREIDWGGSLSAFGYPETLRKTSFDWWVEQIHPEDAGAARAERQALVQGERGHSMMDYRFRRADGSYRYVRDRGTPIRDEAGAPVRVLGHIEDVHLHHLLFLHNPQPMWVFRLDSLQFLAVNEMAMRVYGYSRDEFLQLFLPDIRPEEERAQLIAAVRSPAREHEGQRVWRHRKKNGEYLAVEVRTQDLEWHGQAARMASMTDVTRRIAVEEQLRAREKVDAAGLIAGGLAHDFNNLLTIINGQTERLLQGPAGLDEAERRMALETILEAGQRSAALTKRLMSFVRGVAIEKREVDLGKIIEGLGPFLRRLLPASMELRTKLGADLPPVFGDPAQIEQILLNLAWNAANACGDTACVFSVEAQRQGEGAAARLQLLVADDGPGMDPLTASRAFEPLWTSDLSGSRSGLGLAHVKRIVVSMGGTIQLTSAPGRGARFDMSFPALAREAPREPRRHARILLMEDEAGVRQTLRDALTAAGHVVQEAAHGLEGLRCLESEVFDLVVTDIVMPEREGLEVIQWMRERLPATPVIAISGAFAGQFLQMAKVFGAAAVLQKPLEPSRLVQAVQIILERQATGVSAR